MERNNLLLEAKLNVSPIRSQHMNSEIRNQQISTKGLVSTWSRQIYKSWSRFYPSNQDKNIVKENRRNNKAHTYIEIRSTSDQTVKEDLGIQDAIFWTKTPILHTNQLRFDHKTCTLPIHNFWRGNGNTELRRQQVRWSRHIIIDNRGSKMTEETKNFNELNGEQLMLTFQP